MRIWFDDSRGVRSQSVEALKKMGLGVWAGVFDRTSQAHGTDLQSLGAEDLRGFLFEQFGDGAVDRVAGLSSDLQKAQDLRESSAHYSDDTTSEGLEELRDLVTGKGGDGLIAKIMEVFPATE